MFEIENIKSAELPISFLEHQQLIDAIIQEEMGIDCIFLRQTPASAKTATEIRYMISQSGADVLSRLLKFGANEQRGCDEKK